MIERPSASNVEASAQETHSKEVGVSALLVARRDQGEQFVKQFIVTLARRTFQSCEALSSSRANLDGRDHQEMQGT
jgi:hypothetical protein